MNGKRIRDFKNFSANSEFYRFLTRSILDNTTILGIYKESFSKYVVGFLTKLKELDLEKNDKEPT
jgi:hypothetical protein